MVTVGSLEDNLNDLEYPIHDEPSHPARVQLYMKRVPLAKCLIANDATVEVTPVAGARKADGVTFTPLSRTGPRAWAWRLIGGGRRGGKKNDPLKKFR